MGIDWFTSLIPSHVLKFAGHTHSLLLIVSCLFDVHLAVFVLVSEGIQPMWYVETFARLSRTYKYPDIQILMTY